MRTTLTIWGLAAACLAPLSAWAQQTLALDQALNQALRASHELAAAAHEIEAWGGARTQARAWANPELSSTVEGVGADSRATTVTVSVPLAWGGQRAARIQAVERAIDVARAELNEREAEVRARVLAAFFEALVAQERLRLADDSVALARQAATTVGKRVSAGKVSPVELHRARVDEATAQLEQTEAQGAWRAARLSLALSMGERSPSFEQVLGDGVRRPHRPAFDDLALALERYPVVQRAELETLRREAVVELEHRQGRPDVTLTVGNKRDAAAGQNQAIVGVAVALSLFNRNQGAALEAARRADQAREAGQALRLQVLDELQQASTRLSVANANLDVLEAVVLPAAQQARDDASTGYEAGKFSVLDVLDAQRALLQARTRYLNTLATAHQAAVAIDRITGR